MEFPGFHPEHRKILFFSRGRGRGHVIPDMQIAQEIARLRTDVDVCFVSYGTGAATLRCHGVSHIDLGLPDQNRINDTIVLAGRLIGSLNPDLVVAHEEFSALPPAKIFDKPAILITDWFTEPDALSMGSLRFADRILFLDSPGIYAEPPWVAGKVEYVGPVLRNFQYRAADRQRARRELGIGGDGLVVAVLPGSWRESVVPILEPVLAAFDLQRWDLRHLIWIAGEDEDLIREHTRDRKDVTVRNYEPQIDLIMVAADVVITKGNRKTLLELDYLGVPSVSLSNGTNPIDHHRAGLLPNNRMLPADATALDIFDAVGAAIARPIQPSSMKNSAVVCADRILELCR
ncbi:MAG: hypothetical protein HYX27_27260 [Acidobacteria bacterium]|nr:hypothetical protein [Acidobacteriota bacterium]